MMDNIWEYDFPNIPPKFIMLETKYQVQEFARQLHLIIPDFDREAVGMVEEIVNCIIDIEVAEGALEIYANEIALQYKLFNADSLVYESIMGLGKYIINICRELKLNNRHGVICYSFARIQTGDIVLEHFTPQLLLADESKETI